MCVCVGVLVCERTRIKRAGIFIQMMDRVLTEMAHDVIASK